MHIDLHVKYPKGQILMEPEFSWQIFEKYWNKIHENPSSGTEMFHADGRTSRQTEEHDQAKSSFSQFSERV